MADLALGIAEFQLNITNSSGLPMVLEEGYESFVVPVKDDCELEIEVFAGFTDEQASERSKLYAAELQGEELWNISEWEDGYRFNVYNPNDTSQIQQVAFLSEDFRSWKIHCLPVEEDGNRGVCPFQYPLGPLVMYYLTVANDALMIHASGVEDNDVGRIFSGFSGVGKSTMAGIWEKEGAKVINDDRLMIRKYEDGFRVHNTPMFYEAEVRSAPLKAIYLPYHNPQNEASQVGGSEALSKVMGYSIQHGYNREFLQHHMDFIAEMISEIPVYSLGVVPDKAIISFIKENDGLG